MEGSNLDIFDVGSNASGQSAFNDIEHAWALMSRRLTCVTLSACEEGDTVPPCQNSSLNEEEKKQKEEKILDKAAEDVCGYWIGATFDTFPVIPIAVPSKGREEKFQSADEVVAFLEAPMRDFNKGLHKKELEEFRFLVQHVDRRHNEITFAKCQFFGEVLCDYCAENPPQANKALDLLKKSSGILFEPTPSPDLENHYLTYLQMREFKFKHATSDEFLPSTVSSSTEDQLGTCSECPRPWVFTSKTEKLRHMQLIHRSYTRKTNSKPPANKTSDSAKHVCNFKNCGRKFTSYHKLYQHRKSQGHQQKKRSHSPQKEKNAVKAKKFRSNLMDYLSRR